MRSLPDLASSPAEFRSATRAIRDRLLVVVVPFLPWLYLGWPIPGSNKTISASKLVVPMLAVVSLPSLSRAEWRRTWRPSHGLFLVYLAAVTVSAARAWHPWAGWLLVKEAAVLVILLTLVTAPVALSPWLLFRFNGAALTSYALLLAVVTRWHYLSSSSPVYQVIGTPNVAAAVLAALALWAWAQREYGWALFFIVGVGALGSVGAMLGLGIGLLILLPQFWRSWFAVLAAGAALLLLTYQGGNYAIARGRPDLPPVAPNTFVQNSVLPRLYLWGVAAPAVLHQPFVGYGLGTFADTFLAAERQQVPEPEMPWWRFGYPPQTPKGMSAHSDFLRIAMESGLVAASVWAVAWAALLWELRNSPAALAIGVGFIVQSFTDVLYSQANLMPVIALVMTSAECPKLTAGRP